MPTRRIFELMILTVILTAPAFGAVKLWARKSLVTAPEGSVRHGAGEILVVAL